ncbi:MAG: hypothetical protein AABX55_00620 [Nanoarchaeota archaeon]
MNEKILTLDDATRSKYGKELYDFRNVITHPLKWEDVELLLTESTFSMTDDLKNEVEEFWKKELEKRPTAFDAPKLRFEGVELDNGTLFVYVSDKIKYSQHNVLRNKKGLPLMAYPTPTTIDNLQETIDGYLLFGERDTGISDQSGGAVVGAGFHEFKQKKGITFYPGGIFDTALTEAHEETEYMDIFGTAVKVAIKETEYVKPVKHPIEKRGIRAITFVRGSNTDVTLGFYFPLTVVSDQVDLNRNNKEFKRMLKIKNSESNLELMLETGSLRGTESVEGVINSNIVLADHPIGVLEAYRNMRGKGLIKVSYQH